MFRDSTFSKSSLSVLTPKYLRRAALKQMQLGLGLGLGIGLALVIGLRGGCKLNCVALRHPQICFSPAAPLHHFASMGLTSPSSVPSWRETAWTSRKSLFFNRRLAVPNRVDDGCWKFQPCPWIPSKWQLWAQILHFYRKFSDEGKPFRQDEIYATLGDFTFWLNFRWANYLSQKVKWFCWAKVLHAKVWSKYSNWNFHSHVLSLRERKFHGWNFRPLELSLPRAKIM